MIARADCCQNKKKTASSTLQAQTLRHCTTQRTTEAHSTFVSHDQLTAAALANAQQEKRVVAQRSAASRGVTAAHSQHVCAHTAVTPSRTAHSPPTAAPSHKKKRISKQALCFYVASAALQSVARVARSRRSAVALVETTAQKKSAQRRTALTSHAAPCQCCVLRLCCRVRM